PRLVRKLILAKSKRNERGSGWIRTRTGKGAGAAGGLRERRFPHDHLLNQKILGHCDRKTARSAGFLHLNSLKQAQKRHVYYTVSENAIC
ncbi:hypothetical protein, partial [Butyricicoccus sp. OF27-2pH9A]|uniref:hypothetical protein n=1 Tax=Butyricicoccus sp. OF27-2pH9A TaxID=3002517 RepID=UPI0022E16E90